MSTASITPGATSLAICSTIPLASSTRASSSPWRCRRERRLPRGFRVTIRRHGSGGEDTERLDEALDEQIGLVDHVGVERHADVEAVLVAQRRDVHRAPEARPEWVGGLDQRAADVARTAQAGH